MAAFLNMCSSSNDLHLPATYIPVHFHLRTTAYMFPRSGTRGLLQVPDVLILCILDGLTYIHYLYPLVECSLFVIHPKCHLVFKELLVIITSTWI